MKKGDHHHPEDEREALRLRLRKITGQLNGIDRMLAEDRDCAEILNQLISARRSIKSLSEKLIHNHTHHCINHARNHAEAKTKLRELLMILERYVE